MSKITFPGVARIESPALATDPLASLSPEEQAITCRLNRQNYAVIDFPDPEVGERIAEIKANLPSQFDIPCHDPTADRTGGERRVQDAWQCDEDVCSVWEGLLAKATPVFYAPASPPWPIVSNAMIGRRGYGSESHSVQTPHADAWRAMGKPNDAKEEPFLARKSQALGQLALRNLVAVSDGKLRPNRFLESGGIQQTARSTGTAPPQHLAPSAEAARMHP